ncbi:MAG: hypothetical protein HY784_15280, partial [Chloroflexi bacterium]|nr:hypothetical protein [Chloroflexota bacterium]
MEFLGIGPLELLLIVLIAVLVVGPRDIEKTARQIGQMLNRLYKSEAWKTLLAATREVQTLPNKLARQAELELGDLEDIKKMTTINLDPRRGGPPPPAPEPAGETEAA